MAQEEKRRCAVCSMELARNAFSRKMWQNGKNGGAGRKCMACVQPNMCQKKVV